MNRKNIAIKSARKLFPSRTILSSVGFALTEDGESVIILGENKDNNSSTVVYTETGLLRLKNMCEMALQKRKS